MKPLIIVKLGDAPEAVTAGEGNFEHWIEGGLATRLPVRVVDPRAGAALPRPEKVAGAVVTGSQTMVTDHEPWSEGTAEWLRGLFERALPVLGICYGHQLLAYALGGKVGPHPRGLEAGTVDIELTAEAAADPLFESLPPRFKAQSLHWQSVRELPPGAVRLAGNEFEANHAFRVGEHAWGVQFHPEFSAPVSLRYLARYAKALRDQGQDPEAMAAAVEPAPVAAQVLRRFAGQVERSTARA